MQGEPGNALAVRAMPASGTERDVPALPQEQVQKGCSLTPEHLQQQIELVSEALQPCSRQDGWSELQAILDAAASVCRNSGNGAACPEVHLSCIVHKDTPSRVHP